ncbi:MAG: RsmD family RNA methyltransferase [Tissierellia bacterium]|nr:RsmD family RNA methyltransferase [Tissierellia bacterium]
MRVISGTRKGQKLFGPKNELSRPTEDRIKEAIFNVLGNIGPESVVLDLFACTGSIGIEFLSRGAKKTYFSEIKKDNIEILKRNLEKTKFLENSVILKGDYRSNLLKISEKIDYIYIDAPYKSDYYIKSMEIILENEKLMDAIIITEMDRDENFSEKYDKISLVFNRKYGNKYIKIYVRKTDESSISR